MTKQNTSAVLAGGANQRPTVPSGQVAIQPGEPFRKQSEDYTKLLDAVRAKVATSDTQALTVISYQFALITLSSVLTAVWVSQIPFRTIPQWLHVILLVPFVSLILFIVLSILHLVAVLQSSLGESRDLRYMPVDIHMPVPIVTSNTGLHHATQLKTYLKSRTVAVFDAFRATRSPYVYKGAQEIANELQSVTEEARAKNLALMVAKGEIIAHRKLVKLDKALEWFRYEVAAFLISMLAALATFFITRP
jgi:hypothetical protein